MPKDIRIKINSFSEEYEAINVREGPK